MEEENNWWNEIGEVQQKAIEKALLEKKSGKLAPYSGVMKEYKKWVKK